MRRAGFFAASLPLWNIHEREAPGVDKARRCGALFFDKVT
jgi:hypothetical protein